MILPEGNNEGVRGSWNFGDGSRGLSVFCRYRANLIYTVFQEQYELFPIIHNLHSGVLRLSEARARINIEHINLEASPITRRLTGAQGLE